MLSMVRVTRASELGGEPYFSSVSQLKRHTPGFEPLREGRVSHRGVSEKAEVGAALLTAYWLAVVPRWWTNLVALHFGPGGLGDACA